MLNKNMLGYCIPGNNNLHVCGYEGNKILVQEKVGEKIKKLYIYKNSKGYYFVLKGKRIYLAG
jgi:hypothetical protein